MPICPLNPRKVYLSTNGRESPLITDAYKFIIQFSFELLWIRTSDERTHPAGKCVC
jgi:hypothetical protein